MISFTGEVHPLADMFPMLDEESLQSLADDIKSHGLREPVLIDKQGRLIDGRNRLAACRIAGVAPKYSTPADLNGDVSVLALIVSRNLQRRDLTQGQKAHLALKLLESNNQEEAARIAGVSQPYLAQARTVAKYAPHLVDRVILGDLTPSKAYDIAKQEKADIKKRAEYRAEMQANAPDILAMIDDDFSLEMAWVAYQERDKQRIADERYRAESKKNYADSIWGSIQSLVGHDASDERRELFEELELRDTPSPITKDQIDQAIAILQRIREEKLP